MIGAVVLRLRALEDARLPFYHGHLLHGAFFNALADISPELASAVHGLSGNKPFSLSLLSLPERSGTDAGERRAKGHSAKARVAGGRKPASAWSVGRSSLQQGNLAIRQGELAEWRIGVLDGSLMQCLLALPPGFRFRVGKLDLELEEAAVSPERHEESGAVEETELLAACLQMPDFRGITFDFVSPVTFRSYESDYPFPKPELVWGSLADKWRDAAMPVPLDRTEVEALAAFAIPTVWSGSSRMVYLGARRGGVRGFTGRFTFDVSRLGAEDRRLLLLLAQFAVFSGTGRLTGQGLGQTRVRVEA